MLIPSDALPHFENAIYLPMVLTILAKDRQLVEKGSFKLASPYMKVIDRAIEAVQKDMKESADYLRERKYKLLRGTVDDTFTSYTFLYCGREEQRRYLNVRLKNRTEELMELYLMK
ncbi:hypothetical protein AB1K89_09180 [Sporosarcina sp. 179-K 8C2 HS]|uniref:hypothetical protein n=1 Tax=Sporosarcina sp. 179-K 8C2 HS TaxID=3142387 RepID=UPI0039A14D37